MADSNGRVDVDAMMLANVEAIRKRAEEARAREAAEPRGFAGDPYIAEHFPLLHSLMVAHTLTGGPEKGAALLLWGNDSGIGGMFDARPLNRKAFFDAVSLEEWLRSVERHLGDPRAGWQGDRRSGARSGGRGRKKH